MGHFSDTFMAVCSTPSSPLRVVLPAEAATLLKFLLTKKKKQKTKKCFRGRGLLCLHLPVHFKTYFKANHTEKQVYVCVIKMYLCILTTLKRQKKKTSRTLGDAVFCRKESFLQEPLEDGAHRWPVDQLQHKQVGLRSNTRTWRQTVYLAERVR